MSEGVYIYIYIYVCVFVALCFAFFAGRGGAVCVWFGNFSQAAKRVL